MIGKTVRMGLVLTSIVAAGFGVACGSDDSSSSSADYGSIVSKIDKPTGTVSAATAPKVAQEFEKISSSDLGGFRQVQQSSDVSAQVCTSGGTAKAEGEGNESGGNVTISYGNCCMTDGCCVNGKIGTVYNTDSGSSAYTYCMSYDVSYTCQNESVALKSSGCLNASGTFVYSITVDGLTYSVSGYYADGSGSLTIAGSNGSWTCTYTNNTGSCTGTGGTFSF
jgi:hypothetical protein